MMTLPPTVDRDWPKCCPLMVTRPPAELVAGVTAVIFGARIFSVLSLFELELEFEFELLSFPLLFSLLSFAWPDRVTLTVISPQGVVASTYRRKRCWPVNLGMTRQRQT
jgi:hypothetical protein